MSPGERYMTSRELVMLSATTGAIASGYVFLLAWLSEWLVALVGV